MANGSMEVLKQGVRCLCPDCLQPVEAQVVRDGRGVYLEKSCPVHGPSRVLAEADADFYTAAMLAAAGRATRQPPAGSDQLVILPTYRCNMECRVCYVPRRDPRMDLSLDEIGSLLDAWPGDDVFFAGGEPTVLKNLPEILKLALAKGKRPHLVTNGLRLADRHYFSSLLECGLAGASVSFNAADPEVLLATDGQGVLDAKLRTLANLARARLPFTLSMSVVRGVNENQMGKVLRLALRFYPYAREFLAENCPQVGRSPDSRRIHLSELARMLAADLGFPLPLLLAMVEEGSASIGFYSIRLRYGGLLAAQAGRGPASGVRRLLTAWRDGARAVVLRQAGTRGGLRVRLLSAPGADTVDLDEVACLEEGRLMCASRESRIMPLWEYGCRYQRTASQSPAVAAAR